MYVEIDPSVDEQEHVYVFWQEVIVKPLAITRDSFTIVVRIFIILVSTRNGVGVKILYAY